jgi:RNA polymerase sigma-70 factor (ECF subfamily)
VLADKQEKVFKQWLGEHKGLMFKVVRAYAALPNDQDDLFQEILLQLWRSIPGFDGEAKETTWIYRVALNTAMVWKRGKLRRRKKHHRTIIKFDELPDIQQNSGQLTSEQRIIDRLYAAIQVLPKIDSTLVFMYLDGLSYDEMAEIIGISKSNVGVKLNRAKKQLAQLLKGRIDDI